MPQASTLQERPGYKVLRVPKGPQMGRHVLRVGWPEQEELSAIKWAVSVKQDTQEEEQAMETELYRLIAALIPEWDFIDREGNPLPHPKDEPRAIARLDPATIRWLIPSPDSVWSDVIPNAG